MEVVGWLAESLNSANMKFPKSPHVNAVHSLFRLASLRNVTTITVDLRTVSCRTLKKGISLAVSINMRRLTKYFPIYSL
jgi:hypothetical protein